MIFIHNLCNKKFVYIISIISNIYFNKVTILFISIFNIYYKQNMMFIQKLHSCELNSSSNN